MNETQYNYPHRVLDGMANKRCTTESLWQGLRQNLFGGRFGAWPIWHNSMVLRIAEQDVPEFGIVKGKGYYCTELDYPVQLNILDLNRINTNLQAQTVLGRGFPDNPNPIPDDWEQLADERFWLKRGFQYGSVCRPSIPMGDWNGNGVDTGVWMVPLTIGLSNVPFQECIREFVNAAQWPIPMFLTAIDANGPGVFPAPQAVGNAAYGSHVQYLNWCTCQGEDVDSLTLPAWGLKIEMLAGTFCSQDDQICSASMTNSCQGVDVVYSGVFIRLEQVLNPAINTTCFNDGPECRCPLYPCWDGPCDGPPEEWFDLKAYDRVGAVLQEGYVPVRDWFDPNSQYYIGGRAFADLDDWLNITVGCQAGVNSTPLGIFPLRGTIAIEPGVMQSEGVRVGAFPPQAPPEPGQPIVDFARTGEDVKTSYVMPNTELYEDLFSNEFINQADIPGMTVLKCHDATHPYMDRETKTIKHRVLPPLQKFSDCYFQPGIRCRLTIDSTPLGGTIFDGIGWNTHFWKTRRNSIVWLFGWWEQEFAHDRGAIEQLFPYIPKRFSFEQGEVYGMWRMPLWVELFGDSRYLGFMGTDNDLPRKFVVAFPAAHPWNYYDSVLYPGGPGVPVGFFPNPDNDPVSWLWSREATISPSVPPPIVQTVEPMTHPDCVGWANNLSAGPGFSSVTRYPKRWDDLTNTVNETDAPPVPGVAAMWEEAYDYHDGFYPGWTRHCQRREIGQSDVMDGENREIFPMHKVWEFDTAQIPMSFDTRYYQQAEPWPLYQFPTADIRVEFMR